MAYDPNAIYVDSDGDLWFADAEGYWRFATCDADGRPDFSSGRYAGGPTELVLTDPVKLRGVPARATRAWLETVAATLGVALYGQKPAVIGRFVHLDHP